MTGRYIVTSTEKLVCQIEVEATSKKDAMRRADAILTHGHYNWVSHGTTMNVKRVEDSDGTGRKGA